MRRGRDRASDSGKSRISEIQAARSRSRNYYIPKIATFLRIFAPKGEISNKSDGLNVKSSIRERICSMNLVYTLLMGLIYIYIFVRIFGRWKGAKGKMGLKNRRGIKPRSIFLHAFSAIFSIRSKISREYIDYDGT